MTGQPKDLDEGDGDYKAGEATEVYDGLADLYGVDSVDSADRQGETKVDQGVR